MKREGGEWRLEMLNVWEASWDDVKHVARVYEKGGDFAKDVADP